jgi:maleylpyruvate isomerase
VAAVDEAAKAREIALVASQRTAGLIALLGRLDADAFEAPSRLPGWSRMTIVCHLRYGAGALLRMSLDVLEGRPTSYYPAGRARQRPTTLVPTSGEEVGDVLTDWADKAARLDEVWASLDTDAWALTVAEPEHNVDLGSVPLARLALLRLTEVDLHGVDLGVGFADWSDTLIDIALPTRLGWLPARRTNHRDSDRSLQGTWLLAAEGFRWLVSVDGDRVRSGAAGTAPERPRASIAGTRRDLLALVLGRPRQHPLRLEGDTAFAAAFERAFPGP